MGGFNVLFVAAHKENNHLRVVVVYMCGVFRNVVYFWPLYNFFIQKLPL